MSGFLQNLSSLFGGVPAQPTTVAPATPAPSGAQNPGQPLPNTQQSTKTDANGMVPTQPNQQEVDPNSPQSLLAGYSEVWKPAEVDATKQPGAFFAKLDPAKVMESAKGLDFAKSIDPALLSKITAGGEEAAGAFVQIMNGMTQSGFGQSAITTARLIDEALAKQREQMLAEIPGLVRQHAVSDTLQKENPLLNNPAVKPIVNALQSQLAVQYPNASTAEIQQRINQYFSALGQVFSPQQNNATQGVSRGGKLPADQDFSSFLQ